MPLYPLERETIAFFAELDIFPILGRNELSADERDKLRRVSERSRELGTAEEWLTVEERDHALFRQAALLLQALERRDVVFQGRSGFRSAIARPLPRLSTIPSLSRLAGVPDDIDGDSSKTAVNLHPSLQTRLEDLHHFFGRFEEWPEATLKAFTSIHFSLGHFAETYALEQELNRRYRTHPGQRPEAHGLKEFVSDELVDNGSWLAVSLAAGRWDEILTYADSLKNRFDRLEVLRRLAEAAYARHESPILSSADTARTRLADHAFHYLQTRRWPYNGIGTYFAAIGAGLFLKKTRHEEEAERYLSHLSHELETMTGQTQEIPGDTIDGILDLIDVIMEVSPASLTAQTFEKALYRNLPSNVYLDTPVLEAAAGGNFAPLLRAFDLVHPWFLAANRFDAHRHIKFALYLIKAADILTAAPQIKLPKPEEKPDRAHRIKIIEDLMMRDLQTRWDTHHQLILNFHDPKTLSYQQTEWELRLRKLALELAGLELEQDGSKTPKSESDVKRLQQAVENIRRTLVIFGNSTVLEEPLSLLEQTLRYEVMKVKLEILTTPSPDNDPSGGSPAKRAGEATEITEKTANGIESVNSPPIKSSADQKNSPLRGGLVLIRGNGDMRRRGPQGSFVQSVNESPFRISWTSVQSHLHRLGCNSQQIHDFRKNVMHQGSVKGHRLMAQVMTMKSKREFLAKIEPRFMGRMKPSIFPVPFWGSQFSIFSLRTRGITIR